MQEQQYLLDGLHCAACVRRVETIVKRLENVKYVSVNLADQTAFVQGEIAPEKVITAITRIGFGAELLESEQERRAKQQAQTSKTLNQKKQQFILALAVGAILMLFGLQFGMEATTENRWVWLFWAAISAFTMYFSGKHFFIGAWTSLKNRTATMDTLIAISTGTAWLYSFWLTLFPQLHSHLYFEASVMIIGFLNLGKFLELKAKQRSSLALEKLLDLSPKQAVIFDENSAKITIPVKGIKVGMQIQALAGERLAVDGKLVQGSLWVDESMLTGEALPVEKNIGDKLRAGTIVQDGAGVYIAEQVGSQTALARIITAVRHAQSSKPPLAQWVDKIASIFVPVVVSIAILAALIWLALGKDFAFALSIFTTVLIIACPCALGLAIPLSTIAGVARSAEFGVLVRNIEALQASSEIDTLVFDKTGTLTTGEMQVVDVQIVGEKRNEMLGLVKALEQQSSHPIAKALVKFCENITACEVQNLQVAKGLGVQAEYQGKMVKIGNEKFVSPPSVSLCSMTSPANGDRKSFSSPFGKSADKSGREGVIGTEIFISLDNQFIGKITLQDSLRAESKDTILQFQQQGYHCMMLTGDSEEVAEYYAKVLGLNSVIADVLPEQKAAEIAKLQAQGKKVAMIGDGINDSPALAQANVGIAMHNGSEIAIETADLSLMQAGLQPLTEILPFSKRVLKNMKQSLLGAFLYNIISIPIAAGLLYPFTGWLLNPMIAAIAMALSSITVVLNSQRLLR